MKPLELAEVTAYVKEHIGAFHDARLASLEQVRLKTILLRKNPYLFKAKNVLTASDVVRGFLERLAIVVCGRVFQGQKSSAEGIDLEFTRDGKRFIVAIKSGPNWGNSQQITRMRDNFLRAKRTLNTNALASNVIAVNGCYYGKDDRPDKGDYLKLCGQRFWEFVRRPRSLSEDHRTAWSPGKRA